MVLTAEHSAFHLATPEKKSFSNPFLPYIALARDLASETFKSKPKFKLWDSSAYFNDPDLPIAARQQRLKVDATTFLHEYVGMFAKKIYPYSKYGLLDGYDIPTSEVSTHFESVMEKQGKQVERAKLETWVAHTLEAWMEDGQVPVGAKIITFSPRGSLEEGYPGEKKSNYVFINLYQKLDVDQFQLIQFTSYDTNQHLAELQNSLLAESGQPYQAIPLPFAPQKDSHQVIGRAISIPPGTSINSLEQKIYQYKDKWPVKLEELPQINEQVFQTQLQRILDFCAAECAALSSLPDSSVAAQQLDQLMIIIREDFLKWVENHATNYRAKKEKKGQAVEPYDLSVERIKQRWQLKLVALEDKSRLSAEQKKELKHLTQIVKLDPLLGLGKLASMTHCVVGTPASLIPKPLQIPGLNSLNRLEMNQKLNTMSVTEKQLFTAHLQRLTKLYVTNHETGRTEIWYAYINDPSQADFYQHSCYRLANDKPILGPCDIPLVADGLIDPTWLLTEAEYQAYLAAAFAENLETQLIEHLTTDAEKTELHTLIKALGRKIFRVSLSDLVAGQIGFDEQSLFELPHLYSEYLTQAHDPLSALRDLVETDIRQLERPSVSSSWKHLAPEFEQVIAA